MNLRAAIADYQTDVQIWDEGSRVFAEIDDRHYELDVHQSGPNGYLLISGGRVFNCQIVGRPESGNITEVVVGTARYPVTIIDPRRLRGTASAGAKADGVARLTASMPGKVMRVLVGVGDHVEADAGIVVVEAMKMQHELKSPKAGTVVALNIQTGATVNAGDVLAIIE